MYLPLIFIPSFNVLGDYFFGFWQFDGSSHWLNFDKVCDTAPLCESTLLRKAPVILQREFRKRYRIWSGRRYTRPWTTDPWTRSINAGRWKSWKRWALFFFFLIWFSCIVGIIKTMWLVCYRRSEEKHRLACVFLYILTHFLCAFCNWSTGTPRSSLRIAVA